MDASKDAKESSPLPGVVFLLLFFCSSLPFSGILKKGHNHIILLILLPLEETVDVGSGGVGKERVHLVCDDGVIITLV